MKTLQSIHPWNPALSLLPPSGIRDMLKLASTMDDAIHLSIGQPDFPTPPHIIDANIQALREGKTRYTVDSGLPELLDVIAQFYGNWYSCPFDPENLLVTCGASEALFLAVTSVVSPGAEVVVIEPSFISYQPLVEFAGARARPIVTTAANGYQPDPDEVIAAFRPATSAIILNSPGNPTGVVIRPEIMQKIVTEAIQRGITVISDEVYDRITLDHQDKPGVLAYTDDLEHVISISSVSKTYSMPGFRVGWLISSHENVEKLRRYHIYSSTVNNTSAQHAVVAAFQGDQSCVAHMVAEYTARRNRVIQLLEEIPAFQSYRPDGAFYIMPSLPEGIDSTAIARALLRDTGVCVIPGNAFGNSCSNAVRVSFANSLENIEAAFERMSNWFAQQLF